MMIYDYIHDSFSKWPPKLPNIFETQLSIAIFQLFCTSANGQLNIKLLCFLLDDLLLLLVTSARIICSYFISMSATSVRKQIEILLHHPSQRIRCEGPMYVYAKTVADSWHHIQLQTSFFDSRFSWSANCCKNPGLGRIGLDCRMVSSASADDIPLRIIK